MKVKVSQSCPTLCDPIYRPWNSPGQNPGVGSCSLLQGIFPTQGSNQGLPHCRQFLYQLSHQGSPGILEWGPIPSPADLPEPRNQTRVSCIASGVFTTWWWLILIMDNEPSPPEDWISPATFTLLVSGECHPPYFDRWNSELGKSRLFLACKLYFVYHHPDS